MPWPVHPLIYEINTWTWLNYLSRRYNRNVNLSSVPPAEYDKIARRGFDAVWLMGVWERSPAGIAIARHHAGIMSDLRKALPDFSDRDLVGSPYCIRRYRAESSLGGAEGLRIARSELARRGIRLILDFVPNHVAPDHPWTLEHPEYFIRGTEIEFRENPDNFLESNHQVFARARDPFYPPWPDIIQLDLFNPELREALADTLSDIALQCDGVRCDMAMLVNNDIFAKTWGEKVAEKPIEEVWQLLVPAARAANPEFLFLAEVYWDLEWEMMKLGMDFCYDKRLYDRLVAGNPQGVNEHLEADPEYQSKLVRFLENHDESRAANFQPPERHMAMAIASLTLPGARLIHQGQLDGKSVRIPVFLGRGPVEETNPEMISFYEKLIGYLRSEAIRSGQWSHCQVSGWVDNPSWLNLLAWEWIGEHERLLIVINLSDKPAQGHIHSSTPFKNSKTYSLFDALSGVLYTRDGSELNDPGLFTGLQPWGVHAFSIGI